MQLTTLSLTFLTTLLFLCLSLTTHALIIPSSCLGKSVFSVHEHRQTGPASDCRADLSIGRPNTDPYSTGKLATRDGEPPPPASELLPLLGPKAPTCLDTIEQDCPTIFAAIRDAATNNKSTASLYRNIASSTCLDVCRSGTEPMKWIQWLTRFSQSAVVKADTNDANLEQDWVDWPSVSRRARAAMLPWKWTLVANPSVSGDPDVAVDAPDTNLQCPKRSSVLLSFAVINICMAISGIIFSRRDVIHKLTCGSLGKPPMKTSNGWGAGLASWLASWISSRDQEEEIAKKSRELGLAWLFGGLLTVLLSLAANFVNAVITKSTSGFTDTSIGSLAILWTTRPRVGWFVLLWTNIGSSENTYVSAAWSAVFAELLLQIFASSYLFQTAHYGARSGFFSIGAFQDIPGGRWGLVMYAGAILWVATMALMFSCALAIVYSGAAEARTERFDSAASTMKHRRMYVQWASFAVAFISQWMFWAGYVNVASDTYCPPRIWSHTGVWVGFGIVISVTGGAF